MRPSIFSQRVLRRLRKEYLPLQSKGKKYNPKGIFSWKKYLELRNKPKQD